jgi:hypothetical protein
VFFCVFFSALSDHLLLGHSSPPRCSSDLTIFAPVWRIERMETLSQARSRIGSRQRDE